MALSLSKTEEEERGLISSGDWRSVGEPEDTPGGENAFCYGAFNKDIIK